jgi:hypothetical protein
LHNRITQALTVEAAEVRRPAVDDGEFQLADVEL